jgi:two-component system response regulator YesN
MMAYVEERKGNGYLHMQNLKRFVHELTRMLYKYLNDQNLEFDQIFDMDAFEDYRKAAYCSMGGLDIFTHYIFETLDGNRQNDSRQENILTQLEDYIDQHLGENLSRSVLAKHVYLSEDYISKVFVRLTGMSIPSYIAGRRIDKAKEYIQSTSLPISKIALEVGYSNFSYFSKTFRDLVGCTPNEYRNRNNNKNQS